jgi:hypothetical protein
MLGRQTGAATCPDGSAEHLRSNNLGATGRWDGPSQLNHSSEARRGTRTPNPFITNEVLYQLS